MEDFKKYVKYVCPKCGADYSDNFLVEEKAGNFLSQLWDCPTCGAIIEEVYKLIAINEIKK